MRLAFPAWAALAASLSACTVPYAVGTTARTVAERHVVGSGILQAVSADRALDVDATSGGPVLTFGNEARLGLGPRADVGVRLLGNSVVATYKQRLTGTGDAGSALLVGAGFVGASRLHAEATLVASGRAIDRVVPYGGVRVQAMTAIAPDALEVPPAAGAFGGARIGWPDLAVSPELGIFYHPSPLLRDGDWVIVPSVTVTGDRLMRALGL